MTPVIYWNIRLLGELRARRATGASDSCVTRFRTHKTGALLAYLACFKGPHPREVVIEAIWPDVAPETGRNNLRVALSSLRRQLEPPELGLSSGSRGGVLCANRVSVELNAERVTTDVGVFEAALQDASRAVSEEARSDALFRAFQAYEGRLLPGFYEDWLPVEEERLEALFFGALDELIARDEAAQNIARALEAARKGNRLDPHRPPHARRFSAPDSPRARFANHSEKRSRAQKPNRAASQSCRS